MVTLSNQYLAVSIKADSAELTSIKDQASGHEFLWQADPTFWNRHAPVLFPIVSRLVDNTYTYQGTHYELSRHGFARDMVFDLVSADDSHARYQLSASEATKANYPFDFDFFIEYTLADHAVTVTYEVHNKATDQEMYYTVGGHPAFNVSLDQNQAFDQVDYQVEPAGQYDLYPLTVDGFIDLDQVHSVEVSDHVITREDFKNDAHVYKVDDQTKVILNDNKANVTVTMQTKDMPYVGIWSTYPADAPFVCLEPWTAPADDIHASGDFTEKFAVSKLAAGATAQHAYTLTFNKN
ncbi:aldose 1-epimerase family protein [Aerococcus agrisoli]|nr:aldose 1-epimerase family protein [Aerococcus agrisoli]